MEWCALIRINAIMDVVPKSQPAVDEAQWEEKVKAYHLPRAEINKVSDTAGRICV